MAAKISGVLRMLEVHKSNKSNADNAQFLGPMPVYRISGAAMPGLALSRRQGVPGMIGATSTTTFSSIRTKMVAPPTVVRRVFPEAWLWEAEVNSDRFVLSFLGSILCILCTGTHEGCNATHTICSFSSLIGSGFTILKIQVFGIFFFVGFKSVINQAYIKILLL